MSREASSAAADVEGKYSDSKISRGQWVYEKLRRQIQEGKYSVGARVREEEVARSLGVSRTPVREALSRLHARGLLELAPFGLVVTALTRPQVLELYAMREILEGSAARFAAQHAAPSEINVLRSITVEFEKTLSNPAKLARLNRELHSAIYEAAHNRYLLRTLNELQDTLALLTSTTFTVSGRPKAAVEEHWRIVAAIEKRDPDLAEREARLHIQKALEGRLQMLRMS
jgi:DNA-binding GntR family transcriptional regulator